jgi:hypothetical protein
MSVFAFHFFKEKIQVFSVYGRKQTSVLSSDHTNSQVIQLEVVSLLSRVRCSR